MVSGKIFRTHDAPERAPESSLENLGEYYGDPETLIDGFGAG